MLEILRIGMHRYVGRLQNIIPESLTGSLYKVSLIIERGHDDSLNTLLLQSNRLCITHYRAICGRPMR